MPSTRFVDTGFFLALVNTRDHLHHRAAQFARTVDGPLVTTDAVLTEVANALRKKNRREHAVGLLHNVRNDPNFKVVAVSRTLFGEGFELYASRPDKEWSLTDCISFVVMQQREIDEALAADKDFVQAGFRALLRD